MKTKLLRSRRDALRVALVLLAGASLLLAHGAQAAPEHPFFVQAQFRGHDGGRGHPGRGAMREQRMQQAGAQRAQRAAQREQAQQQRRGQDLREVQPQPQPQSPGPPEQPAGTEGRPGRLTPDERRALRQQINDAGREIYRPRRP